MAQLPESERRRILAEGQRIAARQAQPQRQTQALISESYQELHEETSYEENPLAGSLHPSRWKQLSNPRTVWPADLDPTMVLKQLSSVFVYDRILAPDAQSRGQSVGERYNLHSYDEI